MIRLIINFVVGLLGSFRTIIWLALAVLVIGFGYLVFENEFDFGAAFGVIAGHMVNIWDWLQGVYAAARDNLSNRTS